MIMILYSRLQTGFATWETSNTAVLLKVTELNKEVLRYLGKTKTWILKLGGVKRLQGSREYGRNTLLKRKMNGK